MIGNLGTSKYSVILNTIEPFLHARCCQTKIRNIARSTLDTDATYDEQAKDDQDAFMSQIKESINLAQFADAWPAEAYISRYLAKRASDLAYYELRTNAPRGRKTAFARVNASGVPAKKSPRFPGPCQKQHHSQIAPAGNNCPQENNSVAAFLRSVDPLLERFAGPLADSGLRTVDDLDRFAHNMTSFNRRKFLLDHLQPVPDDIEVNYINNALRKRMTGDDVQE
ncbi:hypothetical protein BJ138DRAFT_37870 [Hygrophoropsis aurantiaca]|uniref:Uncharacterized protein n=1 Tax=Hygrophoropsis aurantiaca TaxID=72124 RepID=A0ACB8ABZ0_9AGAM|nr:hypothetical protein BJ138DRAFT_37870 [Hygrophoropsis aurantiaca]